MSSLNQSSRTGENRRFERRQTLLSARVSKADGIDDCTVQSLSAGGVEIRALAAFQVNEKVTLDLPRVGPLQARVIWSNDTLAGLQFMAPLDECALSRLARSAPAQELSAAESDGSQTDDEVRAELEARLVSLSRGLSQTGLEVALEQIAVLSRHIGR